MRNPRAYGTLLAILLALPALGQDLPAAPGRSPENPSNTPDANTLIPEAPANSISPAASTRKSPPGPSPTPKISKTEANINQMRLGVRLHEAKTVALRDPAIQEQMAWVEAAKTDEGKRERLIKYYKMLYARIVKIDGSLKALAKEQQKGIIGSIEQKNIQKSVLIEPD